MNKKNIIKKLAIFAIAVMSLAMLSGCTEEKTTTTTTQAPTKPPGFLTYENFTYEIRIMYPQEWEKMEDYMNTVVLFRSPLEDASDMFQENLNVVVGDLSQPMKLDEFANSNIEEVKRNFPVEIVDSSSTTLANNLARKVIYNLKQEQYEIKVMQIYTIKDNRAYVITYAAEKDKYSDFLETIQTMIDTFETI